MGEVFKDLYDDVMKHHQTLNIIYGPRGVGKTYPILKAMMLNDSKFIYMRNTGEQIKLSTSEYYNPFKKLNTDLGTDYGFTKGQVPLIISNQSGVKNCKEPMDIKGYGCALTTFGNLRGVDFSDIPYIVWDEWLDPKGSRPIPQMADLFYGFYETVNRNRELNGEPPVIVFALANANQLVSPFIDGIGITHHVENMVRKGETMKIIKEKSILIKHVRNKDFTEQKKDTFLYRLSKGSSYYEMALNNKFSYDDFYQVRESVNLQEYRPYVGLDSITIYVHKSSGMYYASTIPATCKRFAKSQRPAALEIYGNLLTDLIIYDKMQYESMKVKMNLMQYLDYQPK